MSPLGRFLAGILMLFGIGMVAVPAGLIASGFSEALAEQAHRDAHTGHGWRVRFHFAQTEVDLPADNEILARRMIDRWESCQQKRQAPWLHRMSDQRVNLSAAYQVSLIEPGEHRPR